MNVCVLGTGVMGSGIASLFCSSSEVNRVVIWGRNEASLQRCLEGVNKMVEKASKRQGLSQTELEMMQSKLEGTVDIDDLKGLDFYIEAIKEELKPKKDLLNQLKNIFPKNAIIATNTSSLSITELAFETPFPENFIGVHFFNPTMVMKLVEVVKGLTTSDDTIEKVLSIVKTLNKTPVQVNDSPGFIVNRMLIPMINEAISILAEGIATKVHIDEAMKYGANHPLGPLALSDLIGNDVCLSIMESLYDETGDPKYRAHPLLKKYVRAGLIGRKTGEGFYEYQ